MLFITPLLTSPLEFIWQVPHRCHPPPKFLNTWGLYLSFLKHIKDPTVLSKKFLGFNSSLERMAHPLVLERNLIPTAINGDMENGGAIISEMLNNHVAA